MASTTAVVSVALEGITDEPVAEKLLAHAGARIGRIHGGTGKDDLRRRLPGFAAAANHAPWLVMVDLDDDFSCAPELRASWVATPPPRHLCFRVPVRTVEAWLLADAHGLARFLRVPEATIPTEPEKLARPKRALVDLSARSSSREMREAMQPRPGSGREVGPLFPSKVIEFAREHWSVARAAKRSDSLARAVRCIERLVAGSQPPGPR